MPAPTPLSKIRRIAILRAAGRSVATIAQDVGVSPRTVARVVARLDIRKFDSYAAAIEQARAELLADGTDATRIKQELAGLVLDDIYASRALRDLIVQIAAHISESLTDPGNTLEEYALAARGVAALTTSMKSASDIRSRITVDSPKEDLVELPILCMTYEESQAERRRHENDFDDGE